MQGTYQHSQLRYLTIAALFAAMVTVSILIFRIPVGNGIVHFGDAMIYLAACFLPKKYALVAVSIGGVTANLFAGLTMWAPATAVIKPLIAVWFVNKGPILTKWHVCALVIGGIVNTGLYYVYEALFIAGNWYTPFFTAMWGGAAQSGGSAVIFVMLAVIFDRMSLKNRLGMGS
ncbi:MAG: TIGR04002 family protein [Oscillospiraceae bacterium]|nr:TIGR04002 family protein [Oscillospiraceae bacterium]